MKSIKINDKLHETLKTVSARTGIKIQSIVEKAIIEYLKKEKK